MFVTPHKTIKIIVAGNGGVGKTTLLKTLCANEPFHEQSLTVGCDFFIKKVKITDEIKYLQLWDLGGQDQFRSFQNGFLKGALGAILAFDISRQKSFLDLESWIELLRNSRVDIPIVLAATKADLSYNARLNLETIKNFVQKMNLLDYVEVSSKARINTELVFKKLVQIIGDCDGLSKHCGRLLKSEEIEFI